MDACSKLGNLPYRHEVYSQYGSQNAPIHGVNVIKQQFHASVLEIGQCCVQYHLRSKREAKGAISSQ